MVSRPQNQWATKYAFSSIECTKKSQKSSFLLFNEKKPKMGWKVAWVSHPMYRSSRNSLNAFQFSIRLTSNSFSVWKIAVLHTIIFWERNAKTPDFLFSKAYYLESNASKEPELKAFILSDTTKSLQKRIILQNFPLVFTLHSQEKFASSWRRSWRLDWKASLLFSLEKPLGLRIRVEMHPLLTLTLSIFRQVKSLDVMFRSEETLPITLQGT